jgi:hypothetical protein
MKIFCQIAGENISALVDSWRVYRVFWSRLWVMNNHDSLEYILQNSLKNKLVSLNKALLARNKDYHYDYYVFATEGRWEFHELCGRNLSDYSLLLSRISLKKPTPVLVFNNFSG